MGNTKSEIIQSVLNGFRPSPFVKKIKIGLKPGENEKIILVVEFTIERAKLQGKNLNKEQILAWTHDLASKIRAATKLPIGFTETQVKYI